MWLCTTIGFYSAVQHRDKRTRLLVRARCRADLERLVALDSHGGDIEHTPMADYPYRVEVTAARWANLLVALADGVRYDNFKGAVGNANPERARIYHEAWAVFRGIEREQSWTPARFGRALNDAPAGDTLLVELDGYGDFAFPSASPAVDLEECAGCGGHRWVVGGRACDVCNADGDDYPF